MCYKFEKKLKEVIASCGNYVIFENINDDTDLVRDFNFSSIDIIQLVVELESAFDIEIDDDDLLIESLAPYKSLIEILKLKLNEEIL
jgi:acyl carrier protein